MEKFLDVIDQFNDNQKEFLALRVLGIGWRMVMMMIGMSQQAYIYWNEDKKFKEIEGQLVEHKEEYLSQVQAYFNDKYQVAIDYALLRLAHRITCWDKVEKIDKPYVMMAVKMIKEKEGKRKLKDGWLLEEGN